MKSYFKVTEQQETDEKYMRRCLQLAQRGRVGAAPNPMVGAVVVCDGRIIGEGYHRRCGEAHAEVNAIANVREPKLLQHSTLYVSLEPCAHYGKTPPCAQLIIDKHIPTVVVGCRDPFAQVDGRGIEMLERAGVEVREGVLEQECLWLNRCFITFHTHHRPYITLKWAQSKDGYIDHLRHDDQTPPAKFSTPMTQMLVHKMRAENQAILVGRRTWELDHPSLTVRHWAGSDPLPIVLSRQSILIGAETIAPQGNTLVLMDELYQRGIQSLLVEGGTRTLQSFIDAGLWDEMRVEISPTELGYGVAAPALPCRKVKSEDIEGNCLNYFIKNIKTG